MKKIMQIIALFVLTVSCATTHAGVNENKVIQLLSQSIFNTDASGSERLDINLSLTTVTTKTGQKVKNDFSKMSGSFMITNNAADKLVKLEGNMKITAMGMNVTLPVQFIVQTDAQGKEYIYFYVFPQYSQLLRQYLGSPALDGYDNRWIRVDGGSLNTASSTVPALPTAVQAKVKNVWNNTGWFTATAKKSGAITTYSVKINPTVFGARLEQELQITGKATDPKKEKNKQTLLALLKRTTFQITEKNGKLNSYNTSFTIKGESTASTYTDLTNKKVRMTVTTNGSFALTGTVQPLQTIVLPTVFEINPSSMLSKSTASTATMVPTTQAPSSYSTKLVGPGNLKYTIPEGYVSETDKGILYIWKEEKDVYLNGLIIQTRVDPTTKAELQSMTSDAEATRIFKSWGGVGFQKAYVKNINGQTYYIKEQFIPAKTNNKDTGDTNPYDYQLNSLMAMTFKGDMIYVIEFTDDYGSYDRNKQLLETFLGTVTY